MRFYWFMEAHLRQMLLLTYPKNPVPQVSLFVVMTTVSEPYHYQQVVISETVVTQDDVTNIWRMRSVQWGIK